MLRRGGSGWGGQREIEGYAFATPTARKRLTSPPRTYSPQCARPWSRRMIAPALRGSSRARAGERVGPKKEGGDGESRSLAAGADDRRTHVVINPAIHSVPAGHPLGAP